MANISLKNFNDYWKSLYDWAKGTASEVPKVQLTGSKVEDITYSKTNLPAGSTAGQFEIRNTSQKTIDIPHFSAGIREQIIVIWTSLDALLDYTITPRISVDGSDISLLALVSGQIKGNPGGSGYTRIAFAPLRTPSAVGSNNNDIIELPELMLPYHKFRITLQAQTAPTVGEVKIVVARRY